MYDNCLRQYLFYLPSLPFTNYIIKNENYIKKASAYKKGWVQLMHLEVTQQQNTSTTTTKTKTRLK